MQKIHTKLTQKYPAYHNWHHTKHHNKIHWGVLALFSFFIATLLLNPLELNLKKDNNNNSNFLSNIVIQEREAKAAYAPPPGSPLANKEHPRLFFTAKDLPALRDKLKTQYKTELQDFINALDAGFNDDIVAKTQSARSYDAMNYAFLYLVDPGQMTPTFTFGHIRDEYGRKAIAHGLVIANDVLSGKIVDDMPQHLKPINMPMALVYDWTYTILTLQEKQKLTDAFIKSFSNRLVMPGLPLTSGGIYGLHQGPTGALAFWGDNIDDGVTGTYYRDWAQKLLDQLKIDWLDRVYPSLNYFYENSGWRESWSYDGYYFAHVIPFTSMLSSAFGQDYLYNTGYIRYHPLFLLYGLKPRPDDKGKYYFIKYGTDDGTQSVSDSVYNRFIYPIDIIAKSDPDVAGLAKWILDQGYNGSLNSKTYDYLFNHFIFNNKNITPKPPSDLNLSVAQRFGSGQFIMRTGFQDPNSTNIQFGAPKFHFLPGGHPHYDFASFAIEKYGRLALDAGAGKSAPFVEGLKTHLLYSNKESMFHNTIAVYKPGEKDLYGFNYMDYHTRGLSESANKPTDPAYQDGGSNQVGELKAEELNTGNHNYINYNYSRAWDNTKVSYANREFIYLNPIPSSSKEFVIVFDRVISVDPSYTKRWFLWTAFEPEANGTFTQEKAGKWVSNDSNIFKVTNNYKGGLDTYLGSHGRLFSKTLLPTSFKINKLGGPGHEFEDAEGKSLVQTPGTMTNGACDWIGCWHIEVESTTNQKDDLFFHVMEIGDSNTLTTMTPTQKIESSAGNMVGAIIQDPNAPRILMFSRTDPLQTTVTYTTTYSGTGKHLITNLEPATYNIYKDGVKLLSKAVPTGGPKTLYFEADGGGTFFITQGGPPPADTTPPVISNASSSNITPSSATITWTTDEPVTSQVEYGLTTNYGSSTALDSSLVSSHSQVISGLSPSTTYHFRVKSKDGAGNIATSGDYTFTTSANLGDTTPPVISTVSASSVTSSGAAITWMTDEAATSQIEYGTTVVYGSLSPIDGSLTNTHSVSLSVLTSQTTYHYRVRSKDASGNEANSTDYTFITLGTPIPPTGAQFINFQPASSAVPDGYQKDDGSVYSSTRGYGWDKDLTLRTAERNFNADKRLDTFVGNGGSGTATWEYVLLNGNYLVSLASGDPVYIQGPETVDIEGNIVVNNEFVYNNQFKTTTDYPVTVSDGKFTMKVSGNGLINYVIIKSQITIPPDTQAPATPTNLTATAISSSQINLSWTASTDDTGVTGYKIYRCAGSGCTPTVQIATSAVNSYSNTGLTASTVYTYAVSAYDAAGNESGKSSSVSATTLSQFKQADFNQDGVVNQQDFDILKQDFKRTDKPVSDLNQDGIVDSRDLGIMMGEWSK